MLGNLLRRSGAQTEERFSQADYERLFETMRYQGLQFATPIGGMPQLTASEGAANPIVAACVSVRLQVFSEVRFTFQRWSAGRPGEMYGTPTLRALEAPWESASTGDLLGRMELDASLYGNSYWVRSAGDLIRLDPTKVLIVTTDVGDTSGGKPFGKRLAGYSYTEGNEEVAFWLPNEIVHYRPLPDPTHTFRGATWLNPLLPDISADFELTRYKGSYLRNAATPNLVVQYPAGVTQAQIEAVREQMTKRHEGTDNAFRTLYLGGGADVKAVGASFDQLSFKAVQGAGETRIAAAAGVPASIVGISEGLAGSALNAGNYTAARRRFADATCRPLWRSACSALSVLVPPPDGGSRLWFDDRDVSFLQEDVKDEAEIRSSHASTIRTLVEAGFDASSVVTAVTSGDFSSLVHTGLLSVQLQEPGAQVPSPTNGAAA
jgi:phage portal protein BeeE